MANVKRYFSSVPKKFWGGRHYNRFCIRHIHRQLILTKGVLQVSWTLPLGFRHELNISHLFWRKLHHLAIQVHAEYTILLLVFDSLWLIGIWLIEVILKNGLRQTLTQVIAYCLMKPSQYLKKCRLLIIEVQWHWTGRNFTINSQVTIVFNELESYIWKECHISQGPMYWHSLPRDNKIWIWMLFLLSLTENLVILRWAVIFCCRVAIRHLSAPRQHKMLKNVSDIKYLFTYSLFFSINFRMVFIKVVLLRTILL